MAINVGINGFGDLEECLGRPIAGGDQSRQLGHARIAWRGINRVLLTVSRQPPDKGVLPPTAAEHEDAHRQG